MIRDTAIGLARDYDLETAMRYLEVVLRPFEYNSGTKSIGRQSSKWFKNLDLEVPKNF